MSQPAARIGDSHQCSKDGHDNGVIRKGASSVMIEGQPAARVGDQVECGDGSLHAITEGSTCVLIEGQPAARLGDPTEHGGTIQGGASNVFIGTGGNTMVYIGKNVHIGGAPGKQVWIGGKTLPSAPAGLAKENSLQLIYHYYDGASRKTAVSAIQDVTQPSSSPPVLITDSADKRYSTSLNFYGQAMYWNVAGGKLEPIDNAGLHIIEVNGQPHCPWEPVRLTNSEPLCQQPIPDKQHTHKLTAVWPFIHLDYRDFYVNHCRVYNETHSAFAPEAISEFKKKIQDPALAPTLRLKPEHVQYFQTNGNNVTLFIHGYNVTHGQFGFKTQCIKKVQKTNTSPQLSEQEAAMLSQIENFKKDEAAAAQAEDKMTLAMGQTQLELEPSKYPCTLLRTYEDIRKSFPELPADINATRCWHTELRKPGYQPIESDTYVTKTQEAEAYWDTALNGDGDANWALHMEYNLNCAATGHYPFDWQQHGLQYTRALHIFWPGNLGGQDLRESTDHLSNEADSTFHYLRDERCSSIVSGVALTEVLKQLHAAGIKINILAHSLGNRVLLTALHLLAEAGHKEIVDHIFMWEPAVAATALLPGKDPLNHEHFPRAHEAVKQISIFSSEKDWILKDVYPLAKMAEERMRAMNHQLIVSVGYWNQVVAIDNKIKNEPRQPAMGYKGPDDITKKNLKSKLHWDNQEKGRICPEHSSMRIPSPELFEKIYKARIFGALDYCFGKYPKRS